jgi:hypothetical protein
MSFKIFYAWQSDRPNNCNRAFIRKALDKVANDLNAELKIEDALRPMEIEVDQDTQGVPGSPNIAETILQKISESDVFVGDLTFIGFSEKKNKKGNFKKLPNPNVMLEYGFALSQLTKF